MSTNFQAFEVGPLARLGDHVFGSGSRTKEGKVFLSEPLGSDGAEISLNRLEAGDGYDFLHNHRENEEIYVVVSGRGEFVVDGTIVPLREGTAIRVAPAGARAIRAAADEPLTYLCVQAVAGSLKSRTTKDGALVPGKPWPTMNA